LTAFPSIFHAKYLPGPRKKCWHFRSNLSSVFQRFEPFDKKIASKNVPTECVEFEGGAEKIWRNPEKTHVHGRFGLKNRK
jgi:hypothetical protein